jgi:hypothetical protein
LRRDRQVLPVDRGASPSKPFIDLHPVSKPDGRARRLHSLL